MLLKNIKFLTLILCMTIVVTSLSAPVVNASVLSQEEFKTHLRWQLRLPKGQLNIKKNLGKVELQTLNIEVFAELQKDFSNLKVIEPYVKKIMASKKGYPSNPAKIVVELTDPGIELFSFYKDSDSKYILDFWFENKKQVSQVPKGKSNTTKPAATKSSKKSVSKKKVVKKQPRQKVAKAKAPINRTDPRYRDFRYGGAFIWDYEPLMPSLKKEIDLRVKTPEYFYPIKDRDMSKVDDLEKHLQLSINLYRNEKFGLMNKSINLFEKKYGQAALWDINEYLRANALLKNNLNNKDLGPKKAAIAILDSISQRTNDYLLKTACIRYILQFYREQKDHLNVLKVAKRLFVETYNNFDKEIAAYSTKVIVHTLAALGQTKQLEDFIQEKRVAKLLPKQNSLTYRMYVLLKQDKYEEVIKEFKKVKDGLIKPIQPSILYNVAEAYFRNADYIDAIEYFDSFVSTYSYYEYTSRSRLRIAMAYDIMDRDLDKVLTLYRTAIDKSTNLGIRYEAKLRYVGLRIARKKQLTKEDKEFLIFLEQNESEKNLMDANKKKLLWLVRLRTLINQAEYAQALAYLNAIPLKTLKAFERKIFEGDGAEIILGLLIKLYKKGEFSKLVKIWDRYADIFNDKVASEPYAHYILASSYMNLGLNKGTVKSLKKLSALRDKPIRTYPIWVDRDLNNSVDALAKSLEVEKEVKAENWEQVIALIKTRGEGEDFNKADFYKGIAYYHTEQIDLAIKIFENFFVQQVPSKILSEQELSKLMIAYSDSVYKKGNVEHFKRVANALLNDIEKSKGEKSQKTFFKTKERLSYLLIETLAGDSKAGSYLELEPQAKKFMKNFETSVYKDRVQYLLGVSLVKNKKVDEGKDIFRQLISDKDVPEYLKELCKSELTALKLEGNSL